MNVDEVAKIAVRALQMLEANQGVVRQQLESKLGSLLLQLGVDWGGLVVTPGVLADHDQDEQVSEPAMALAMALKDYCNFVDTANEKK
jgi:hypothetical protein